MFILNNCIHIFCVFLIGTIHRAICRNGDNQGSMDYDSCNPLDNHDRNSIYTSWNPQSIWICKNQLWASRIWNKRWCAWTELKILFILTYTWLIMALVFWGLTVGLYWLLCAPLKMDLKGVVKKMPFPKDDVLKILAIVYFILVKPYVEEWFWRRYNYDIFLNSTEAATSHDDFVNHIELEFWIVSFFWALTYTVISILAGATFVWALIICLIFMALGRFLIWIRWQHGWFANQIKCYYASN